MSKLGNSMEFKVCQEVVMSPNYSDCQIRDIDKYFILKQVIYENGFVYVKGNLKGVEQDIFRVIAICDKMFSIYFSDFNYYILA